jgi:hypothetical protein
MGRRDCPLAAGGGKAAEVARSASRLAPVDTTSLAMGPCRNSVGVAADADNLGSVRKVDAPARDLYRVDRGMVRRGDF